ncbi:MAG: hypothetical protein B6D56_06175 [Candidatus Omnitrophica bacterium 4484_70.1]|nr:MAG: hypothetical protein B6D56_06175 [Candidatus Omnitrophica bacterium 4484_70.1]
MKRGFTLVELLVVLVIIGILVAVILPASLRAIRQANTKKCASNIRSIDTAIQMCYSETRDWTQCNTMAALANGLYFPDEDGDGVGDCPNCPFAGDADVPTDCNDYNIVAYDSNGDGNPDSFRCDRAGHFTNPGQWPDTHDGS